MKLKTYQKNILHMFVIVVGGFILFNVAFFLAFLVNRAYMLLIMIFTHNIENIGAMRFSWHYVYIVVVLILSWFVFRTKLNDLAKSTFSTMPLIVLLTEVGIRFYQSPLMVYIICSAIVGAILLYLYNTKRSWLYYFAVFYVVAVGIFVMLTGMEI